MVMPDFTSLSDRQIDALVAEKVMELIAHADGHFSGRSGRYWLHAPHYSTDVSQAVLVLDKIADVWSIVHTDHPDYQNAPYEVTISNHEGQYSSRMKHFTVSAATLPRAICEAALAVVEKK